MKKILITCTDLMMVQFLVPHVRNLSEHGFCVELACSDVGGRLMEVLEALPGVTVHSVRLKRSPVSLRNLLGWRDLKRLITPGKYQIIWTNEPVMGVFTRLAARGSGAKLLYLCHGFHFYRGCCPVNWIFYPIERAMSRLTDVLVTINREDEALAKSMHAGEVAYIHGIGINTERLEKPTENIRRELGLAEDDFLVLSVGELNRNKNHQVILRAVASLHDPKIHYAICGKGPLREKLSKLSQKLGIEKQVHFLGYRKDMGAVYAEPDLLVHPSRREGLGLAPLEAVYCGLPLIASDTRGIRDYGDREFLFPSEDVKDFARAMATLKADKEKRLRCAERSRKAVAPYTLENAKIEILTLLERL